MMTVTSMNPNDPEGLGGGAGMRGFPGGPGIVDQTIRQAVSMCWMMMPQATVSIDAVEAEVQRIVKRVFENLREDAERFPGPGVV